MIRRSVSHRRAGVMCASSLAFLATVLTASRVFAVCGDGVLDVGELCDGGANPSAICCTAACTPALIGTECRPAAGECDLPEVCNGVDAACPTNVFKPAGLCRAAAGPCDIAENCSGIGPACPVDSMQPSDVVCRPSATICDVAETCTGSSIDCPADSGEPDTDQDGTCDQLDLCPLIADPLQTDTDGDGQGDACDPCTNVVGGGLQSPRLALAKLSAPGDDDRLRLKGSLLVPDSPPIDPVHKGLRLILAGPLGVVFDAMIPAGSFDADTRAGWLSDGDRRWFYKNGGGQVANPAGIRKILLRGDRAFANQLRIVVSGRGGDLRAAVGQPSLTITVVIDAPMAATGQCAEAQFVTVGTASECRLLNSGHRLECRKKD